MGETGALASEGARQPLIPQHSVHTQTLTGHTACTHLSTIRLSELKAAEPCMASQAVFQHLLAPTPGSAPHTSTHTNWARSTDGLLACSLHVCLALTCARDAGPDSVLGVVCLFPLPVPSCHSVHVPVCVRVPPLICFVPSWTNALSPVFSQMPSHPCTPALGPSRTEPQTQKPLGPASAQLLPALSTSGAGSHSSWAQVSW